MHPGALAAGTVPHNIIYPLFRDISPLFSSYLTENTVSIYIMSMADPVHWYLSAWQSVHDLLIHPVTHKLTPEAD